jgi:hypothetical protein
MGQTYPKPLPPEAYLPAYVPVVSYNWPYNGEPWTGRPGNDVNVATANATGPYEPKNQGNKANMLGDANRLAVDITTPSGWIGPGEGYKPPPTPTLTALVPDTRVIAPTDDLSVQLIGTNFMPSSQIFFAGHFERTTYVSPTELRTLIRGDVFTGPDVVAVGVINDNIPSNALNFAFTAA